MQGGPDGVVARSISVLGDFPAEQAWVLVGGLAVFIRLGSFTRPTADADTVAQSQAHLVERVTVDPTVTVVARGKLRIPTSYGDARVDIMDLGDAALSQALDGRMFALARKAALASAQPCDVVVSGAEVEATIPVATIPALVALKAVAVARRPHGATKAKVGSDIHDLVRLVGTGPRGVADGLVRLDPELAAWIGDLVRYRFDQDLRMTLTRLRRFDRSAGAQCRRLAVPGHDHAPVFTLQPLD